jgi:hypothetical protein
MPCGSFRANAVFFAIGALTANLYLGFRPALGSGGKRSQVQTARWRFSRRQRSSAIAGRCCRRRHIGYVRRYQRALRAHHAGRRRHFWNGVMGGNFAFLTAQRHAADGGAVPEMP